MGGGFGLSGWYCAQEVKRESAGGGHSRIYNQFWGFPASLQSKHLSRSILSSALGGTE